MFKMTRTFHPVGQGAFYTERFDFGRDETANVVYDCGSLTNRALVEARVRNTFEKEEAVQAIFVSHFDEDHVNGIPFLLNWCKVEKLFLPILTTKNLKTLSVLAWASTKKREDSVFYQLLNLRPDRSSDDYGRVWEALGVEEEHRPKLVWVNYSSDENREVGNVNAVRIWNEEKDVVNSWEQISLSQLLGKGNTSNRSMPFWFYLPYNYQDDKEMVDVEQIINDYLSNQPSQSCLNDDFWKDPSQFLTSKSAKKSWVDAFFKAINKEICVSRRNKISMTVYSGPSGDDRLYCRSFHSRLANCKYFCHSPCGYAFCCHTSELFRSGCLYTGDYDAKTKKRYNGLRDYYRTFWNYIGCLQVPHHGSDGNYNSEFESLRAVFVVSYGTDNTYGHPGGKFIHQMYEHNIPFFAVTEDGQSIFEICYDVP